MLLCDALVEVLIDLETRYLFGVSGANIEHVHDAVQRRGRGLLQSVLCKHEAAAAFMADGHARAGARLGVCCATSGGGMLNLLAGVAEAQSSGVPLLALIGLTPLQGEGRGGFQDASGQPGQVNAEALWRACTQYAAKPRHPAEFWSSLWSALRSALGPRAGASALLLPRDLMACEVGPRPRWFDIGWLQAAPPAAPAPSATLRALRTLLARAQRPVLIVGPAAVRHDQGLAVLRWVESCGISVVSTLADVAAFPHAHPQYLGCIGVAGHPSAHEYLATVADAVLALGTPLDAMTLGPMGPALARLPLAIVHADLQNLPAECAAALCIAQSPAGILEELNAWQAHAPLHFLRLERYQLRHMPAPLAGPITPCNGGGLRASEAIALINERLPDGARLMLDAGNCAATAAHYLRAPRGASASIALGMGGMGYGLSAAIGAQLARPADAPPSVVFCGDGAFLMHGTELHTAVELGLRILWIVFNNGGHGMCATRQDCYFEARRTASEFRHPVDCAAMAQALAGGGRLWASRVAHIGELLGALPRAMAAASVGPAVLELRITQEEIPPFAPFHAALAARPRAHEHTLAPMPAA